MCKSSMARPRKEFTLSTHTIDYLKNFNNASRVIDEAIELHKNKDKQIILNKLKPKAEVRIIG